MKSVEQELHHLKKTSDTDLAINAAVADLAWLGAPVQHSEDLYEKIRDIQEQIAGGTPLKHQFEHLGESHIIAVGEVQLETVFMLSDDFNARITAKNHSLHALSTHRLMHEMIKLGVLDSAKASAFSGVLLTKRRFKRSFTEDELIHGKLASHGMPTEL